MRWFRLILYLGALALLGVCVAKKFTPFSAVLSMGIVGLANLQGELQKLEQAAKKRRRGKR